MCVFGGVVLRGGGSRWTLAAAVAIAAFGPMTLSEVGTSFADILTALPVIAGLGLIVSATARHRARHLIAGILIGGAVGLKLTNMIFFLSAGASLLFAARPLMALSCFAIGGVIGGLGTGGAVGLDVVARVRQPGISLLQHDLSLARSPVRSDGRSPLPAAQFVGSFRLPVFLAARELTLFCGAVS